MSGFQLQRLAPLPSGARARAAEQEAAIEG